MRSSDVVVISQNRVFEKKPSAFMHILFLFHPIYQVITYNEYLPGSLGPVAMSAYNLNLGNPSYDDKLDPQAANEFATAAFRFGHNEVYFNHNDFFI